ncbi:hypothetical protein H8356DRAFT_1354316 [Neocallimastix lanati (nom. inval.)]|nr:hypothetical protein H8356DRAFT_1354316 [Neocallimastix sp. JGI-2020a]
MAYGLNESIKISNSIPSLKISEVYLGCMILVKVTETLDLGINFFNTINCYNDEDVVIATTVRFNKGGLSFEATSLRSRRIRENHLNSSDTKDDGIKSKYCSIRYKVRVLGCGGILYQLYNSRECARQNR